MPLSLARTRLAVGSCSALLLSVVVALGGSATSAEAAGNYEPVVLDMADPHVDGELTRLADGRVLVTGGEPSYSYGAQTGGAEVYTDGPDGYWYETGPMLTRRVHHSATLLADGRVLVAGGYGGGGETASTEIWNPRSDAWSAAAPMAAARSWHEAVLLDGGKVLVIGGGPAEIYDPTTNTWAAAAPLPNESGWVSAAIQLNNGQVLVTLGGEVQSQLYTPSTNSWSPAGSSVNHGGLTTKLNDGRVLVHKGPVAEIFDPATKAWTATAPPYHNCGSSIVTVSTGTVLVPCPNNGHDSGAQLSQVYDPVKNVWKDSPVGVRMEGEMAAPLSDGRALIVGGTDYEDNYARTSIFVDGVPGSPAEVSAGAGNGQVQVSWSPPSDIGTSPITGYTVTGPGISQRVGATVRSVTFTSLTNGTGYSFSVTATNAAGVSQPADTTTVVPSAVRCTISGTAAANVLTGTAAADVICGLGGNDVIKGQSGNDTIIGGAGIDSVDFANATAAVTANLSTSTATGQGTDKLLEIENVDGSAYADRLTGDNGPNRLSGKAGKDTLSGLGDVDQMYGGGGDDQVVYSGTLDAGYGGLGIDAASFALASSETTINLTTGRGVVGDGWYAVPEHITLTEIENVIGSAHPDHITGSAGANLLRGGAGDDDLSGAAGNDKLYGDTGSDSMSGGVGTDYCGGGADGDTADSTCETRVGVP